MVALPNLAILVWPGPGLLWLGVSFAFYVGVMVATRFPSGSAASRPAE
jgi:hypothetical protein